MLDSWNPIIAKVKMGQLSENAVHQRIESFYIVAIQV